MNITETIYKLEMIFPPSFFNSMDYLPIYLTYVAKVKGHVQYKYMFLFERLGTTYMLSNCPLPFIEHLVINL
jgi:hypothetical protein